MVRTVNGQNLKPLTINGQVKLLLQPLTNMIGKLVAADALRKVVRVEMGMNIIECQWDGVEPYVPEPRRDQAPIDRPDHDHTYQCMNSDVLEADQERMTLDTAMVLAYEDHRDHDTSGYWPVKIVGPDREYSVDDMKVYWAERGWKV
jgi:hypothetical protein